MKSDKPTPTTKRESLGHLFWNVASLNKDEITDEEVEYFREHPDQIDEVASPIFMHRIFLAGGLIIGIAMVAISKLVAHGGVLGGASPMISEFLIDIVFEVGVSLIGAAIVTFMMGIALNQQQHNVKRWRREMRSRIKQKTKAQRGSSAGR